MSRRRLLLALTLTAWPAVMHAQSPRARLESRGLPAELVQQVVQIAADATAQGLPADPVVDKAIEGFAKHVPSARIATALQQFTVRMLDGRAAVRQAGIGSPDGSVVTAAAEALGRGIGAAQVGTVVHAAPQVVLVAPGLTVAAALASQGMGADEAVAIVTSAMRNGRSASQILDLPSVARAMQTGGISADEAGRRMLRGGGSEGGPRGGGPEGPHGPGGNDGPGAGGHGPDGRPGGPPPPPQRPPDGGRHGGPETPKGGGPPGHP